ncbi:ribonuclease III [Psychrosphaera saromensis]|uniref:Ribonuclease 3 n=1 Tax=Psychrosphaera saromensis TaxID=716813 RepID=A0A2S7V0W9_9GAMM|nr:ribonuclease III [Psychrosphaera saromensis]PQJ55181.1 ribonuclease III [Psychrosphaera saromensis]
MKKNYSQLAKLLGYQFNDESLLVQALTHRSFKGAHNERLEFVGDALLGMFVAEALYFAFPKATEGELTRMRSQLVKGQTLTEVAKEYDISSWLLLGPGEMKSGGFRRDSILEDAIESIIGAVYLDSDIEQCRTFVLRLLDERLKQVDPSNALKDPKTQLQEWLQSRKRPLPTYEVAGVSGQAHNQTFKISCTLDNGKLLSATGTSRRKAEQAAARKALEVVKGE